MLESFSETSPDSLVSPSQLEDLRKYLSRMIERAGGMFSETLFVRDDGYIDTQRYMNWEGQVIKGFPSYILIEYDDFRGKTKFKCEVLFQLIYELEKQFPELEFQIRYNSTDRKRILYAVIKKEKKGCKSKKG